MVSTPILFLWLFIFVIACIIAFVLIEFSLQKKLPKEPNEPKEPKEINEPIPPKNAPLKQSKFADIKFIDSPKKYEYDPILELTKSPDYKNITIEPTQIIEQYQLEIKQLRNTILQKDQFIDDIKKILDVASDDDIIPAIEQLQSMDETLNQTFDQTFNQTFNYDYEPESKPLEFNAMDQSKVGSSVPSSEEDDDLQMLRHKIDDLLEAEPQTLSKSDETKMNIHDNLNKQLQEQELIIKEQHKKIEELEIITHNQNSEIQRQKGVIKKLEDDLNEALDKEQIKENQMVENQKILDEIMQIMTTKKKHSLVQKLTRLRKNYARLSKQNNTYIKRIQKHDQRHKEKVDQMKTAFATEKFEMNEENESLKSQIHEKLLELVQIKGEFDSYKISSDNLRIEILEKIQNQLENLPELYTFIEDTKRKWHPIRLYIDTNQTLSYHIQQYS